MSTTSSATSATTIRGDFEVLIASDVVAAFMQDEAVKEALRSAVASALLGVAPSQVRILVVVVLVADRSSGRRLSQQAVRVDYAVDLPAPVASNGKVNASSLPAATASSLVAELRLNGPAIIAAELNSELPYVIQIDKISAKVTTPSPVASVQPPLPAPFLFIESSTESTPENVSNRSATTTGDVTFIGISAATRRCAPGVLFSPISTLLVLGRGAGLATRQWLTRQWSLGASSLMASWPMHATDLEARVPFDMRSGRAAVERAGSLDVCDVERSMLRIRPFVHESNCDCDDDG